MLPEMGHTACFDLLNERLAYSRDMLPEAVYCLEITKIVWKI